MLDSFLKVAHAQSEKATSQERLVEKMTHLPEELLHKIASGEEKLAFGFHDDCWIEKYKGTPLFDQALELEKQELQQRMSDNAHHSSTSSARDELSIQRKMLDLQLLEAEAGGGGEEPMPEEELPPEAMAEGEAPPEEEVPEEAPDEEEPPAEEPPAEEPVAVAPPAPEKPKVDVKVAAARMRMAMAKEAIGLGMLAKGVGAAAKSVAKPAMSAARGAGGGMAGAQMAGKVVKSQLPGAAKSVGRMGKSYLKNNPGQAAALAGGAGLAGGAALS